METPYLDVMINELEGYIGSSDNSLSKKGNEKLNELKAIKEQLSIHGASQQTELLKGFVDWFNKTDKTQAII